jgi:DNA repair protein REV1
MKRFCGASRLHCSGTWRARRPARMQELAGGGLEGGQYGVDRFATESSDGTSDFIHVDMDCFFVSVLLRTRPQLWSQPVAVAHSSSAGSSEVSSCNYPARARGVKAGMFMRRALELCPSLRVMRYDFPQYQEASKRLYQACLAFSPRVQPVSVDELFVECLPGHDVRAAAQHLREEIFRQTGCRASAGEPTRSQ